MIKRSSTTGMLPAKLTKTQIQDVYASKAHNYDAWGKYTEANALARSIELAAIQDGEQILEVAVGTGLTFEQILARNPNGWTMGIDLTEEMLAQAKQKAAATGNDRYTLQRGDAYHLPFESGQFDLLINSYMFDLLPEADFGQVLGEFWRVLRPGGRLVLVNMGVAQRWYQSLWETIYRLGETSMGGCRGVVMVPYLISAEFEVQHHEIVSQLTFPSEIIVGVKS